MRKNMCFVAIGLFALTFMSVATAADCNDSQQSGSGATNAQVLQVPKNAKGNTVEQQNINDRLAVTTDFTRVMWIHILSIDGRVITRLPVRNKVTSSGKRLEPLIAAPDNAGFPSAPDGDHHTTEFIEADGTYGSSDSYIFWFDPLGRYNQLGSAGTGGLYLLTDYPIDLANPQDSLTGLYNADKAATAWQLQQEKQLCQSQPEQQNSDHCK